MGEFRLGRCQVRLETPRAVLVMTLPGPGKKHWVPKSALLRPDNQCWHINDIGECVVESWWKESRDAEQAAKVAATEAIITRLPYIPPQAWRPRKEPVRFQLRRQKKGARGRVR